MIGLLLAGGQSRRFGQDKALYRKPDQSANNAAIAVSKLSQLCDDVLVSANANNAPALTRQFQSQTQVTVVEDDPHFANQGPLSGLFAAVTTHPRIQEYLLLAVDYPKLPIAVLASLANQPNCYAKTPEQNHYAISHFVTSQAALFDFLRVDDHRLSRFILDACGCLPILFNDSPDFKNYNYLEDFQNET